MKQNTKVFIFSAPSGSGKTTIIHELMKELPFLELAISATTRKPRGNEIHGKDYYFISVDEFKQKIKDNQFVEWEEVYENKFYGTLKSEIERILRKNHYPCFDVDVKGGVKLKEIFKDKAVSFFIKPPSIETLRERLIKRNTDTPEDIEKRLARAKMEMQYEKFFDYVILNDDLQNAVNTIKQIILRNVNTDIHN